MKQEEKIREAWVELGSRYRLFAANSFPRYLWHSIRENELYQRGRRFWIHFRRYRLISRIITVTATLLTVMGTGAAILLFSLVILLVLPIILLLAGGTMLLGQFRRRKQNALLRHEITGRTVYLFFLGALRPNSFSSYTAHQLARAPQSVVFVISPYSWSAKGLGGDGFYINARQEAPHLFLLRRHYFFFFRQLLKSSETKRIVVIL